MRNSSGMLRVLLAACLVFCSIPLDAKELVGRVTSVLSGDRIVVQVKSGKSHGVRLAGVDAPDAGQPIYKKSAGKLSRVVRGKRVRVVYRKRDRKDRRSNRLCGSIRLCDGCSKPVWKHPPL